MGKVTRRHGIQARKVTLSIYFLGAYLTLKMASKILKLVYYDPIGFKSSGDSFSLEPCILNDA